MPEAVPAPAPIASRIVLVLYSDDRQFPANVLFDTSLREALGAYPGEIEICSEFLDQVRFPAHAAERMRDLLRAKYAERPPDVIVTFAPPALDFWLEHRSQFFTQVPIVFAGMGTDMPTEPELGARVTGVRSSFDGAATLRLALRLHPRTRQVFVIDGSAPEDIASTFRQFAPQTTFHHLTSHPLVQLLEELSRLPENSLVIDLSPLGSHAGRSVFTREMAQQMDRVSRAPIYAAFDPFVGYGVVGAVTTPMDAIGREAAQLVARVLKQGNAGGIPAVETVGATPIFDWRQLRRWGLRKSQLPPGSLVRFEPPSFWRQHLALVVTTSGLILLQSGLIIALVLQSRRRRRAEREVQSRRGELEHMTRVATMGELTASLAHEINQPLAAILSNAQAGQRLLAAGATDEIGEILSDIAADDRRAGEVIRRMRALLRKGESELTNLNVNDLVAEVIGFLHGEMILQNVSLALDLAPDPLLVHGDQVQLQQVLLNLVVNAMDAMKEIPGGSRRLVLRTTRPDDRTVQLSVEDSGVGVPADRLEQVFEPFVTTKSHGIGLGLSICRSILQAHGGRIGCTNSAGNGTSFWFTLPAVQGGSR